MTSTRLPVQIFAKQPLNVAATSLIVEMRYLYDASVVINCTGVTTNAGTFTIETSNDGVLWIPLDIDIPMTLGGVDHTFYLTVMGLNSDLMRLSFAPANADGGIVTATLEAKAEA